MAVRNEVDYLRIGFIGAGKVGFTLGKYFSKHGKEVVGYYSRNTQSAAEAAAFTKTKVFETIEEIVKSSDVLFLTVPDGVINDVYREVVKYPVPDKFICHCSGAMTAGAAFPDIREYGAFGYSVHPLFAVSNKYKAYKELADVFFALEGDPEHMPDVEGLMKSAWLSYQRIDSNMKVGYHCGATVASNLVVGLVKESVDILCKCGFSEEDALSALTPLIRGNVQHVLEDGLEKSLTGALERGDAGTIVKHLDSYTDEDSRELYKSLSRRILPIAKNKHPERDYSKIEEIIK